MRRTRRSRITKRKACSDIIVADSGCELEKVKNATQLAPRGTNGIKEPRSASAT